VYDDPLYRPADFGMLRTPVLPMRNALPGLGGNVDEATDDELVAYLRASASDPVLREAIGVSTPSLAQLLDQVVADVPLRSARLRNAALSVARYVIRAGNRSTPFGVLAGVAPLYFGSGTDVVPGAAHVKHVSLDGAWLAQLLRDLESRPEIMRELDLVVDHEAVRKGCGVHYYTDARRSKGKRTPSTRKVVRSHVVVDRVLELAARPLRGSVLLDQLTLALPCQSRTRLTSAVAQLVRSRLLLTSLRPPLDARDPLEHLLSQLVDIHDESVRSLVARLRELQSRIDRYRATAVGQGNAELAQVHQTAARLTDRPAPDIQVDLRLAERVTLPHPVAEEAADTVAALWRMSRRESEQRTGLREYLGRFEEEYGRHTLVPLSTLLDAERGLGHPAVWAAPSRTDGALESTAEARQEERRRSLVLAGLVWPNADEVLLTDATVDALSRTSPVPPPVSTDAVFELVADSAAGIDRGDYRLVFKGQTRRAGATFGRFGPLLPEIDESLREVFAYGADADGVPAQLVSQATAGFAYVVGDAPRWLGRTVRVGEIGQVREGVRRTDHDPADLLIGVRDGYFRVVSATTGEELQLVQANVMRVGEWATPAARFLAAVCHSRARPWHLWDWGELSELPRLPRVRYRNSILSLERWRPSHEMVEAGDDLRRWQRAFDAWRERYAVPDDVAIGVTDRRLVLDLRSALHRQLLHEELRKVPDLRVEESSVRTASGAGWLHGRVTEVVLPLLATTPRPSAAPDVAAEPLPTATAAARPAAHTIGGEWLYAKFYSSLHLHDEILGEHLPRLLDAVAPDTDRWFFLRYRDPGAHIRLRLHGNPDRLLRDVLPLVRDWAAELCDLGLVREWSLHSYRPETLVYGGAAVMSTAECAFRADSLVAAKQLSLLRAGGLDVDQELALALNLVDIAREMRPQDWSWFVETVPRDTHRERFRARRDELRSLVGADRDVVAKFCGGDELADAWRSRAAVLAEYREELSRQHHGAAVRDTHARVLKSLLHMHHNRARGIDVTSEAVGYAMARGFAEMTTNTARYKRS
jgi:thiopeptide-type bacteriocin biosynthesis protein